MNVLPSNRVSFPVQVNSGENDSQRPLSNQNPSKYLLWHHPRLNLFVLIFPNQGRVGMIEQYVPITDTSPQCPTDSMHQMKKKRKRSDRLQIPLWLTHKASHPRLEAESRSRPLFLLPATNIQGFFLSALAIPSARSKAVTNE